MPTIETNGIDIAYDSYGAEDRPALLMIMGLGMPSTAWPPALVELLVSAGYRVLTFDNRDIGRSRILEELGTPGLFMQGVRHAMHLPVNAPYTLEDMAADSLGLLDALGVPEVHVIGASMGGMIAQLLALTAPDRVVSLTSIMSTTSRRGLPGPTPQVRRVILRGPKDLSRAARFEYYRKLWPLLGSPAFPQSPEKFEEFLERIYARGMPRSGAIRQALAVMAATDRTPRLRHLRVPTLIIHGDADAMLPVECGYDTAEAIRDAEMVVIEGMGHNLPEQLLPRIAGLLVEHARMAESEANATA